MLSQRVVHCNTVSCCLFRVIYKWPIVVGNQKYLHRRRRLQRIGYALAADQDVRAGKADEM